MKRVQRGNKLEASNDDQAIQTILFSFAFFPISVLEFSFDFVGPSLHSPMD